MNIGLIGGSYKPCHAGHFELIMRASKENDEVHLYVSTSDRKRKGEFPIMGSDMETIWKDHLEPILPSNVIVEYGGSPVAKIYKELEIANLNESSNMYKIYSDPEDMENNYPENSLTKYAKNLYLNGQIVLVPTERTSTVNISGTQMRQFLQACDKDSFLSMLPQGVNKEEIWKILSKKVTNEIILRKYIKFIINSLLTR